MSGSGPSRFATAVLNWFLHDNDALAGDLLERRAAGQSRFWFWRQVLLAIAVRIFQHRAEVRRSDFNLSASALPDVAGFALVSACVLVTLANPSAWWIFLPGVLGGLALGVTLAIVRSRAVRTRPTHADRTLLRL